MDTKSVDTVLSAFTVPELQLQECEASRSITTTIYSKKNSIETENQTIDMSATGLEWMCRALNSRVQQSLSDAWIIRKGKDHYSCLFSAKLSTSVLQPYFTYHDIFAASALLRSEPS